MARKVKCPVCDKMNPKDETVKLGNRYYCPACAEERNHQQLSDWDILFQYICWLYRIPNLTGQMYKQLKDYRDNWEYTDIGMYHTLRYYHEILGKPVKDDAGLGIIPYYYDRARAFIYKQYSLKQQYEQHVQDEKEIYVQRTQPERWKKREPLNFDTVDWGDTNED